MQISDNLLKTQLDGLPIGFLWLSVPLKYHYRQIERKKTRDKEHKLDKHAHRQRERARERERQIKTQRGRLNEGPLASNND